MTIGAGHFEMNAVKAFFELNWIPYLEKMCELMGFNTENAKHFAKLQGPPCRLAAVVNISHDTQHC